MKRIQDMPLNTFITTIKNKGVALGNASRSSKIVIPLKDRQIVTGWTRIPDALSMKIKLGNMEPILGRLGINKRVGTEVQLFPFGNKRMNRYMQFQLCRLEKMRSKPNAYWRIALYLLRNSVSFRVSAIHKVFPNWYKSLPLWVVLKHNERAQKIIETWNTEKEYTRVYIPKGKDTYRPLGVPKPEWRLVLHMWNNFLYLFLYSKIGKEQVAYRPGLGVIAAWKKIITSKVYKAKFVYEADLKQFFPSVYLNAINNKLTEYGTPAYIIEYLHNINKRTPKLPKKLLLDEDHVIRKKKTLESLSYGNTINPNTMYFNYPLQELNRPLEKKYGAHNFLNNYEGIEENLTRFKYMQDQINFNLRGVNQGTPTSPLLSTLTLKEFLRQPGVNSICYADDPIFWADKEFKIRDIPSRGIILHPEKSGWVKYDGEWKKPLKYLGLELGLNGKELKANTRKGSKLKLPGSIKKALYVLSKFGDLHRSVSAGSSKDMHWTALFNSDFTNWMISRLYEGKWNSEIEQDFTLRCVNESYLKQFRDTQHTLVNSGAFACRWLYMYLRNKKRRRKLKLSSAVKSLGVVPKNNQ